MESRTVKAIDVICQHKKDGGIIPLRVRLSDEDGQVQVFSVKSYRDMSHKGTYTTPDGVYVTNDIMVFECNIIVLATKRLIRLYYDHSDNIWQMGVPSG